MVNNSFVNDFFENGYFVIQNRFPQKDIDSMRLRIENIILGKFKKLGRRFQTDTDPVKYNSLPKIEMEYRGPNVAYRKIADLEYDDCFLRILQSEWVLEICTQLLGDTISIMRFTMMEKPALGGTPLPWHQDFSLDWPTTVPPKLAIWFPLDKSTASAGTLQIIPGSHKDGAIGRGHRLPPNLEKQYAPANKILDVEINPGDCLFFHAALLHRSGVNRTDFKRRAVNVLLMAGNSIHTSKQRPYPVLKGAGQLEPDEVARLSSILD